MSFEKFPDLLCVFFWTYEMETALSIDTNLCPRRLRFCLKELWKPQMTSSEAMLLRSELLQLVTEGISKSDGEE